MELLQTLDVIKNVCRVNPLTLDIMICGVEYSLRPLFTAVMLMLIRLYSLGIIILFFGEVFTNIRQFLALLEYTTCGVS